MATDTRTNRFETKPCTMDQVGRYTVWPTARPWSSLVLKTITGARYETNSFYRRDSVSVVSYSV
jgi:hypothetical protein